MLRSRRGRTGSGVSAALWTMLPRRSARPPADHDVYTWLTHPTMETAVAILSEHGYRMTADQVAGVIDAAEKQRGGVFGTAQQMRPASPTARSRAG